MKLSRDGTAPNGFETSHIRFNHAPSRPVRDTTRNSLDQTEPRSTPYGISIRRISGARPGSGFNPAADATVGVVQPIVALAAARARIGVRRFGSSYCRVADQYGVFEVQVVELPS